MDPAPYAFSAHHFISSVGADAGFAAIIGLAILVLLYFAQARETASLREQALQSAQRVQQLEARLAQLMRPRAESPSSAGQSAPAPPVFQRPLSTRAGAGAGAGAAAAIAGAAPPPAAPAGVAAPALTAATRLIPLPVQAPAAVPPAPRPAAATVAAQRSISPPGAPAAPAANGPAADAVENGAGIGPGAQAGAPPPRVQIRPESIAAGGRRQASAPRALAAKPASRRVPARLVAVLLAAVAVGGAVAVLLVVTSSGGKQQAPPSPASNSNATVAQRGLRTAAAFKPASVTVAVLNGTPTAGLAASFSQQLGKDGYKIGATTNAADQTHTSTSVAYIGGQKAAALHVASSLGLGVSSVQPIDQNTQAIACPPPSPCGDEVIVTLGSDLASRT